MKFKDVPIFARFLRPLTKNNTTILLTLVEDTQNKQRAHTLSGIGTGSASKDLV